MTPERIFPTEDEVTAEIASHRIPPESLAEQDQHIAAMDETYERVHETAVELWDAGMLLEMNTGENMVAEQIDALERNAMRMIMAAKSFGIWSMCSHTESIRPLLICCDPPFVVCLDCAGNLPADMPSIWYGFCDCCGAQNDNLVGYQILIANLVIEGDVCADCMDRTKQKDQE